MVEKCGGLGACDAQYSIYVHVVPTVRYDLIRAQRFKRLRQNIHRSESL